MLNLLAPQGLTSEIQQQFRLMARDTEGLETKSSWFNVAFKPIAGATPLIRGTEPLKDTQKGGAAKKNASLDLQSILNINDYFQFVITATESQRPKPSPVPYLEAMESLCLDPKETLIIEDSKTGLISAVNSGAHVVGLKTSLSSGQMKCISKKIYAINHFRELTL